MNPFKVPSGVKCNICLKLYSNRNSLLVHKVRVHHQGTGFPCITCNTKFATSTELKKHEQQKVCNGKKQNRKKPIAKAFKCRKCPNRYASEKSLKVHVDTNHNGISRHHCPTCSLNFGSAFGLSRHNASKHSSAGAQIREAKENQKTAAQKNRDKYEKFLKGLDENEILKYRPLTLKQDILKLLDVQQDRIKSIDHCKPDTLEEVKDQRHIDGFGYISKGKKGPITYEELPEEAETQGVYGYIWRDKDTFQIIDIYIGLSAEPADVVTRIKWKHLDEEASSSLACYDRCLYKKGHFFCPSEAFMIEGAVAIGSFAIEQLKWICRNETGSICSHHPLECYTNLGPWIRQIKQALIDTCHNWMPPSPVLSNAAKMKSNNPATSSSPGSAGGSHSKVVEATNDGSFKKKKTSKSASESNKRQVQSTLDSLIVKKPKIQLESTRNENELQVLDVFKPNALLSMMNKVKQQVINKKEGYIFLHSKIPKST